MSNIMGQGMVMPDLLDEKIVRDVNRKIKKSLLKKDSANNITMTIYDTVVEVPEATIQILVAMMNVLETGRGVSLYPKNTQLNYQQAAEFLDVSDKRFNMMIKKKIIKNEPSEHFNMIDLVKHKKQIEQNQKDTLARLTAQEQNWENGKIHNTA